MVTWTFLTQDYCYDYDMSGHVLLQDSWVKYLSLKSHINGTNVENKGARGFYPHIACYGQRASEFHFKWLSAIERIDWQSVVSIWASPKFLIPIYILAEACKIFSQEHMQVTYICYIKPSTKQN